MIIVMPNGYPARGAGSTPEGIEETGKELLTDLLPLIERSYRVVADADHRAIAGLSMGAGQAFMTGLRHIDSFAWVGAFSSGVISDAGFRLEAAVPGLLENSASVNKRMRLLFLSCGTEDPRYSGYIDLMDKLKQHNIHHEWYPTPGVHEWKVWRHSLAAMLPRLFQPKQRVPAKSRR
jgi:enterochelin esterase family protein